MPEKLNWIKNGKCKVSVNVGRVKGKCKNVGQDYNPNAHIKLKQRSGEKSNWVKNSKVSVKVGRVKGKCTNVGQNYNPYALQQLISIWIRILIQMLIQM